MFKVETNFFQLKKQNIKNILVNKKIEKLVIICEKHSD